MASQQQLTLYCRTHRYRYVSNFLISGLVNIINTLFSVIFNYEKLLAFQCRKLHINISFSFLTVVLARNYLFLFLEGKKRYFSQKNKFKKIFFNKIFEKLFLEFFFFEKNIQLALQCDKLNYMNLHHLYTSGKIESGCKKCTPSHTS